MIPVGGHYTIDAAQAKHIADELSPTVVIPMHYRQGNIGFDEIGALERFTSLCDNVVTYNGPELEITPKTGKQTVVLKPKNA